MLLGHGTVYGEQYYTVDPMGLHPWREMEAWCTETFGPTVGSIWGESPVPLHQRWYQNNSKFWFRSEADRTWFVLRWS